MIRAQVDASVGIRKLQRLRDGLGRGTEDLIDEGVREMQDTAVGLAPRRTGTLADTLARSDAIEKEHADDGRIVWRFGFLSEYAKRVAWYWRFPEFGTRAYEAGQMRAQGVDKHGRIRLRKMKRAVPARRATPYLRPAFILFKQKMQRLRAGVIVNSALREGPR